MSTTKKSLHHVLIVLYGKLYSRMAYNWVLFCWGNLAFSAKSCNHQRGNSCIEPCYGSFSVGRPDRIFFKWADMQYQFCTCYWVVTELIFYIYLSIFFKNKRVRWSDIMTHFKDVGLRLGFMKSQKYRRWGMELWIPFCMEKMMVPQ